MKPLANPKNILVVALSGIGNWLMQAPTIAALKKQYPEATITAWVAPRGTKILAENNPNIDVVIESSIKMPIHQHFKHVYRLAKERYDVGIMLSPGQLWKGAAYLFLAGAPIRIGNAYPFRGNPESCMLLTHGIPELPELHDIEQNLRLLEPLGIPVLAGTTQYTLAIPEKCELQAKALLELQSIPTHKKLIGFHMGCAPNLIFKRWPIENFIALGKRLVDHYQAHILLFGGNDENDLKKRVEKELNGNATSVASDLLTTAAVIKHCQIFISNDSGLMHVAAAVGVPTFGLFGPTDERQTGPRGPKSYVVRAPGIKPVYNTEKNFSVDKSAHESLFQLSSQFVLETISKLT